jgi:hypothetical protein
MVKCQKRETSIARAVNGASESSQGIGLGYWSGNLRLRALRCHLAGMRPPQSDSSCRFRWLHFDKIMVFKQPGQLFGRHWPAE